MVIPRVEMAVISITSSSRHGRRSEVLCFDRRDYSGNARNTPLMSTSSCLDLKTNQDRYDETRGEENFEDGIFPASRSKHDWRAQAHDIVTRHNAPQNSIHYCLTGRSRCQNDPPSQKFNEPQNMVTQFHPIAQCQCLSKHRETKLTLKESYQ